VQIVGNNTKDYKAARPQQKRGHLQIPPDQSIHQPARHNQQEAHFENARNRAPDAKTRHGPDDACNEKTADRQNKTSLP